MEVLERYLQAVRHWLPVPQQDDIVAELAEDIRSQIEEREAAAGRPLEPAELEALLRGRGHPMWVAEGYLPSRHLIGPALLPVYLTVRKVALACLAAIFAVCYVVFAYVVETPPKPELGHLGFWAWYFVLYGFAVVGFQTILFAWIERAQVRARASDAWDPSDPHGLPVRPVNREAAEAVNRRLAALASLLFNGIFTIWWLGLLNLDLGPEVDIRLTAVWRLLYWPLLAIALSGMALAISLVVRPRRSRGLAALGLARGILVLATLALLLAHTGGLVDVVIANLPPDRAGSLALWANASAAITLALIALFQAAEVVRDARVLRGQPPIRHRAFRLLTGD
jgi:hypothetical protein